jgi:hypothetical protein
LTGRRGISIAPDDPHWGEGDDDGRRTRRSNRFTPHNRESRLSWEGAQASPACTFTIEGTRETFFRDTFAG